MPRFSICALLLIVLAAPARGGDPDPTESSASENFDPRTQLEELLERIQKSRNSAERRTLTFEALPLAKHLAMHNPGADSQRRLCELSLRARDVHVVAVCEEAVAKDADGGSTRFLLAKTYTMAERWQDAETALLETLELLDEGEARRPVYEFLGLVYQETQRIDEAIDAYAKAGKPGYLTRTKGGHGEPKYDDTPLVIEDLEPWRTPLKQLLEEIRESRGLARRSLYARARSLAQVVATHDPGADNQRQLCEISIGAKDVNVVAVCEQAVRMAEAADAEAEGAGWNGFLLANAYSLAERWRDAETVLLEAIDLSDETEKKRLYTFLGFIYEKTKRYEEAIHAYAQGNDPTHVERVKETLETSPFSIDLEGLRK